MLFLFRMDEESSSRQRLERELGDAHRELRELEDDLQKERGARSKAEKNRRDMAEELEAYKAELEESNDKSALHVQMRAKREEDYNSLQVNRFKHQYFRYFLMKLLHFVLIVFSRPAGAKSDMCDKP